MNRMKLATMLIALFLSVGFLAVTAEAQLRTPEKILPAGHEEDNPVFIKVGQAGFAFLKLPTNARTAALADAGTGLIGSAAGVFTNPATLRFLRVARRFLRMWNGLQIPRVKWPALR